MAYVMKGLGYPRTPTDAVYRVEMPDGSKWDVPVQVIADSRDKYYAEDGGDTIGSIQRGGLRAFEIGDWAGNNMNWDEVQAYAVRAVVDPGKVDFQEGWVNGEKQIVGKI